jgi:hypothetical protein
VYLKNASKPLYAVCAHAALNLISPTTDIKAPTHPSLNMPFSLDQCIANGVYAASIVAVRHQAASSSSFVASTAPSFYFFSSLSCRVRNSRTQSSTTYARNILSEVLAHRFCFSALQPRSTPLPAR